MKTSDLVKLIHWVTLSSVTTVNSLLWLRASSPIRLISCLQKWQAETKPQFPPVSSLLWLLHLPLKALTPTHTFCLLNLPRLKDTHTHISETPIWRGSVAMAVNKISEEENGCWINWTLIRRDGVFLVTHTLLIFISFSCAECRQTVGALGSVQISILHLFEVLTC